MTDHEARIVERHRDVCIIGGSAGGLAAALELVRLRRSVIVVDADEPTNNAAERAELRSYGGEILTARASRVRAADDGGFVVELAGGHSIVARRVLADIGLVAELPDVEGLVEHRGLQDAAEGSRVGAVISSGLADEELHAAAGALANESDWDARYGAEPMWSGNPNGTLVNEVTGLPPGRALDVGAGEGADALWLAEQGWRVSASDVSQRALERVSKEARRRGLRVECHHADANDVDVYEAAAFDLVSAQYASIPRTPDGRAVRNLLGAVAPGGTLLIVSHDLEPMRAHRAHQPFDPDAYVTVDDFAAVLADSPAWEIEVHEKRHRPPGAASAAQHVDDIVLRARRCSSPA